MTSISIVLRTRVALGKGKRREKFKGFTVRDVPFDAFLKDLERAARRLEAEHRLKETPPLDGERRPA